MVNWRNLYRLRRRIKMEQLSKQRWFNNTDTTPIIPHDTSILLYPTYTFSNSMINNQNHVNNYSTRLRASIAAPGNNNSRKNKIILSLCRQYLKEQSNTTQHRLAGFLSRSVSSRVIIDLINNHEAVTDSSFLDTDPRGLVSTVLETNYIPQSIRITLDTPSSFPNIISNTFNTHYIKPNGIGLISDVDDTIKHTGVTGDKKSMFKNVFVAPWQDWIIEGIPQWYNQLSTQFNVDFFYVSNSPLQLYTTLQNYISNTLPNGPIFLKQYAGHIVASIMNTSAANKKMDTIEQILQDFSQKKFILVGDSGEKDFETYIELALKYPGQILAIYIRCCKDSISDASANDHNILNELNEIIANEYTTSFQPPIIPQKPRISLTDSQISEIKGSRRVPPPLPRRPNTTNGNEMFMVPSTQNDYNTYNDYFDKKADSWKIRVHTALNQLKSLSNSNINIRFFIDPSPCISESSKLIRTFK